MSSENDRNPTGADGDLVEIDLEQLLDQIEQSSFSETVHNYELLQAACALYKELSQKERYWMRVAFMEVGVLIIPTLVLAIHGISEGTIDFALPSLIWVFVLLALFLVTTAKAAPISQRKEKAGQLISDLSFPENLNLHRAKDFDIYLVAAEVLRRFPIPAYELTLEDKSAIDLEREQKFFERRQRLASIKVIPELDRKEDSAVDENLSL